MSRVVHHKILLEQLKSLRLEGHVARTAAFVHTQSRSANQAGRLKGVPKIL